MAIQGEYFAIPGLKATGDLSSSQYLAVKMASTAGAVKVCSATTDNPCGILQNKPTDGQPAEVAFTGCVKAQLAASVTVSKFLGPNTTGQLAATSVRSNYTIAKSIEASTNAGEIHPVLLTD